MRGSCRQERRRRSPACSAHAHVCSHATRLPSPSLRPLCYGTVLSITQTAHSHARPFYSFTCLCSYATRCLLFAHSVMALHYQQPAAFTCTSFLPMNMRLFSALVLYSYSCHILLLLSYTLLRACLDCSCERRREGAAEQPRCRGHSAVKQPLLRAVSVCLFLYCFLNLFFLSVPPLILLLFVFLLRTQAPFLKRHCIPPLNVFPSDLRMRSERAAPRIHPRTRSRCCASRCWPACLAAMLVLRFPKKQAAFFLERFRITNHRASIKAQIAWKRSLAHRMR